MGRDKSSLFIYSRPVLQAHQQNVVAGRGEALSYQRMLDCNRNWQIRERLEINDLCGERDAFMRCRQLLCPSCLEERRIEGAEEILQLYLAAIGRRRKLIATHVAFVGPQYPIFDAAECVGDCIENWGEFSAAPKFKHAATGLVRGFSLLPDFPAGTVRAQCSMMVLVARREIMGDRESWLNQWNLGFGRAPSHCRHFEEVWPSDQRARHAVEAFAGLLAAVAVSPKDLCTVRDGAVHCDPEHLKIFQDALRNRRLIAFSGMMSRANANLGA